RLPLAECCCCCCCCFRHRRRCCRHRSRRRRRRSDDRPVSAGPFFCGLTRNFPVFSRYLDQAYCFTHLCILLWKLLAIIVKVPILPPNRVGKLGLLSNWPNWSSIEAPYLLNLICCCCRSNLAIIGKAPILPPNRVGKLELLSNWPNWSSIEVP